MSLAIFRDPYCLHPFAHRDVTENGIRCAHCLKIPKRYGVRAASALEKSPSAPDAMLNPPAPIVLKSPLREILSLNALPSSINFKPPSKEFLSN